MHILLININPVVSRLISLCVREDHMNLEEVHSVWDVTRDKYDIVFIDEASYVDEAQEVLKNLIIRKRILFSNGNDMSNKASLFDTIIKKPFLPSQITAVLENLTENDTLELASETPSIFPLSSDEESKNKIVKEDKIKDPEILDTNEIEKIKALLEMEEETEEVNEVEYENRKREVITQQLISDGLEIIDEDEYVEILSKKPSKKKKSKSRKNEDKKKKEKNFTFEEALLAAIEGMKVKKIKKLLKDAEVTIKINFKDKK